MLESTAENIQTFGICERLTTLNTAKKEVDTFEAAKGYRNFKSPISKFLNVADDARAVKRASVRDLSAENSPFS